MREDGLGNYGYAYEYQINYGKWIKHVVWCKNEKERDEWLEKARNRTPSGCFSGYRKFKKQVR